VPFYGAAKISTIFILTNLSTNNSVEIKALADKKGGKITGKKLSPVPWITPYIYASPDFRPDFAPVIAPNFYF
jgi:hypothetical protein